MLQASLLLMKSLNKKRDSHIPIRSVFFVSKGNLFDVYFTTLQLELVPCGSGGTSPLTSP